MLWSIVGHNETEHRQKYSDRFYLEAIINNRLPLTEEPVVLPQCLQLYGCLADSKIHRIEPKQQLSSPHLSDHMPRTRVVKSAESSNSQTSSEKNSTALERALRAVDGGLQP